ncbi:hypothetical protein Q3G72_008782 [Acer saccharum]|nr:hypothetical protein Q3G72_008782 [Acer saccharum]
MGNSDELKKVFSFLQLCFSFVLFFGGIIFVQSPSEVPRIVLPPELFANIGVAVGDQVNQALQFLQDAACGGNLKQFLVVVASLWVAAVIRSWCNFLIVLCIGFQ